jgi:hypothetical protein
MIAAQDRQRGRAHRQQQRHPDRIRAQRRPLEARSEDEADSRVGEDDDANRQHGRIGKMADERADQIGDEQQQTGEANRVAVDVMGAVEQRPDLVQGQRIEQAAVQSYGGAALA